MMLRFNRLPLLIGLALLLAACAKQRPTSETTPAAAAQTAPGSASTAATIPGGESSGMAVAPSTIKRLNEDGSETVEDTSGDTGAHNPLYAAVAAAAAATTSNGPSRWQAGVNYTRLVPAQPTSAPPGQVEVLEFFWYACPHCYALDPLVEAWRKTKAPYVSFSRVPVTWNPGTRSLARLFYTLQALGKLDELHTAIFKEIHVNNDPLTGTDDANSERMQLAFVRKFDVSAQAFTNAYHSFSVETDLQRADELVARYRITGVPTFVVNGKYVADVGTAGGENKLLELVSDLAASEHKHT